MKINEKIIVILKDYNIKIDDGICYLMSIYHGYSPSFIPLDFKLKMNQTRIVVPCLENKGVTWNLPLYEGVETAFSWVKEEFVPMFKEKNNSKGGHVTATTARMKKFFSENAEYRKDDVITATRNYLANTDGDYIRFPHYFISKGKGLDKTSDLLDWLERLKEEREYLQGRQGSATTMQ